MGAYRNGIKIPKPYINGVRHNAYLNGKKIWPSVKNEITPGSYHFSVLENEKSYSGSSGYSEYWTTSYYAYATFELTRTTATIEYKRDQSSGANGTNHYGITTSDYEDRQMGGSTYGSSARTVKGYAGFYYNDYNTYYDRLGTRFPDRICMALASISQCVKLIQPLDYPGKFVYVFNRCPPINGQVANFPIFDSYYKGDPFPSYEHSPFWWLFTNNLPADDPSNPNTKRWLYTDPDGTNHYPWNRGEGYYIGDVEKVEIEFETDIAHQFLTMCTAVQSQNGDFYSGHGTTNWLALGSIKVRKDSVILKGVPYVNGGYGLFEQATGSYVVFGINNIVYLSDYLKLSNIYDLGNGYFAGFIKEHYNSTFVDTNDSNRVKGCLKLDFQIITSTTYGGPTTDYNMSVEFRPEAVGGLSGNYKTLVFTYPPEFLTIPKLYILSVRDAVIPL